MLDGPSLVNHSCDFLSLYALVVVYGTHLPGSLLLLPLTASGFLASLVIPHEVSHTVLATFYRKIIPRWADEGFASHVETQAVRSKLIKSLTRSLAANRGIAFGPMFSMKDYPSDILPLYAQGYTLTTMLIEAKDEKHFLEFLGAGIDSQDWPQSVKTYYGYESLEEMEQVWKQRVNAGGF